MRGHAGCEEAATHLQQQFTTRKGVIVTLDYSQCYDRLQVGVATQLLRQMGWPAALVAQMQQVWNTNRYLQFEKHVHPRVLQGKGIPQGCPLAPLCLATVMACGHRGVDQLLQTNFQYSPLECQSATTRIYMDDRSFVDTDVERAVNRAQAWSQWSAAIGLMENENKVQALGKTKAVQQKVQNMRPEWAQEKTITVLGISIRACRAANTVLEVSRITAAKARARLLATLPVTYHRKLDLYRTFVLPKALYGWISRFPPKETANQLFNALTMMTSTNRMASPCIRSTLYGGNTHVLPLLGVRLFKRLAKMRSALTWTKQAGTPVKALRDWLQSMGWRELGPWKWGWHNTFRIEASTNFAEEASHALRHSWRMDVLKKFAHGKRHEAAEWRRLKTPAQMRRDLEEVDLGAARTLFDKAISPSARAVLLGSVVSPAWLGRSKEGENNICPFCQRVGTWMHMAWQCFHMPRARDLRPRQKPDNWLSCRFGWPTISDSSGAAKRRLDWLAHVMDLILQNRYA